MALESLKENIMQSIESASEKLKDPLSIIKDLKDASSEKMNSLVNDLFNLAPLIEKTGFSMKEVNMELGIPPGINLIFTKEKDIAPETIEELLEENPDKEMFKLIVRAIQKADTIQKGMNLTNFTFKGMNIKLGLPPDVNLKFEKK
jgi:hypothetical protein